MPSEPASWRRASEFGDTMLYLTAASSRSCTATSRPSPSDLGSLTDASSRPRGAPPVSYLRLAFPMPESPARTGPHAAMSGTATTGRPRATGPLGPRGPLRRLRLPGLLHERAFRRFWLGQSVSMLGDQVTLLAVPLLAVLVLHAGAQQMGLLVAVGSLPSLLLSMWTGSLVDRYGHRRVVMLAGDVGRAALLVLVALTMAMHVLGLGQLRGRVRARHDGRGVLRRLQHAVRLAGPARAVRRGNVAAQRQPRVLVLRRAEPGRVPGGGADRTGRAPGGRGVVPRLGRVPRHHPAGRATHQ